MLDVVLNGLMWHLDEDRREFNPIMPLAIAFCLFAVSVFFSWQEFKYFAWGRAATAKIVEVRGKNSFIHYEWTDADDGLRHDYFSPLSESDFAVGMSLDIEYLPGVMASRLAGTPLHHKVALVVFCLSLLAIIWYIAKLWRQGNRELAETAARASGTGRKYEQPS